MPTHTNGKTSSQVKVELNPTRLDMMLHICLILVESQCNYQVISMCIKDCRVSILKTDLRVLIITRLTGQLLKRWLWDPLTMKAITHVLSVKTQKEVLLIIGMLFLLISRCQARRFLLCSLTLTGMIPLVDSEYSIQT